MEALRAQWNELIPQEIQKRYTNQYDTTPKLGERPVLIVVDVYNAAYDGGNIPPEEMSLEYRSGSGIYAYNAIEPTQQLIEFCRSKDVPVVWLTKNWQRFRDGVVSSRHHMSYTNIPDEELERLYSINPVFDVRPEDKIVRKNKSSGFTEPELAEYLTEIGCTSTIMCGTSTSGCVRATATDSWNNGFYPILIEETCFEANQVSRAINLWDIHHKYGPVISLEHFKSLW